jgi:2-haloacid dehalogenase
MEVRALAFDVFGTVVDWRSSVAAEFDALVARLGMPSRPGGGEAFADAWRRRYGPSMDRVRNGEIEWTVLDELHRASLEGLLGEFGLGGIDEGERERLNSVWHRLRPWPDSVPGLTRLRTRYPLCTLSNGNVALLVDLARFGGLPFDCILSAELCQAYKPDPRTYHMVWALLRVRPQDVLMVAAHTNDLHAAAAAGLRTAFVQRPTEWGAGAREEQAPDGSFDLVAQDLVDLAERMGC